MLEEGGRNRVGIPPHFALEARTGRNIFTSCNPRNVRYAAAQARRGSIRIINDYSGEGVERHAGHTSALLIFTLHRNLELRCSQGLVCERHSPVTDVPRMPLS
jgi:hypothetical protein